jgi:hypothetical protein
MADMTDMADMTHGSPAEGLRLAVSTNEIAAGSAANFAFKVTENDGTPVTTYEIEQTKELHLVLVRSDLSGFQHLHPTRAADATWSTPIIFATGGTYRVVADFVPVIDGVATGRTAVPADIDVSGSGSDTPLPAASSLAAVDGFTVKLDGQLSSTSNALVAFSIADAAGQPVTLEPYLGANGHLVAFAESDLAYTHIHPNTASAPTGRVEFTDQVADIGLHRLYLQFSVAGTVHTAAFTATAV